MRRAPKYRGMLCEALEDRQLMSLTIEVRNTDGSATATATSVGQVLTLEVLAVISSSNNDPTQDALADLTGSFVSSADGKHSVAGNLAATNLTPFKSNGAAPGTVQDLNGDGNLDVGSNAPFDTTQYFFARSQPPQGSSTGTIVGNTLEFKIATLKYTITHLNQGGQTSIRFVPYNDGIGASNASWFENNQGVYPAIGGVYQAGSAFVVSDPAIVPPPVAVDDSFTVPGDTSTALKVLANDDVTDPLNDASVLVAGGPSHGSTQLQSNGTLLYTPTNGYRGADSFTYTVADVDGHVSNAATVNVTVVGTPAPVAANFGVSSFSNQTVSVNVLSHVTSGAALNPASVLLDSNPSHGTATVQSDGSIQYIPSENFTGTDTFTYSAGDANNENSNVATVTLTVTKPVPPTAVDDNFNVTAGTATVLNVQTNDIMGSVAISGTVTVGVQPKHGTATVQGAGNVLYTPAPGYVGTDSFKYVDTDTLGDVSNIGTVTLTIAPAMVVIPIANPVSAQVPSGMATAISVLANDTGAVPSTVAVVTAPTNGAANANADGTITYTSLAGFVGSDSFTYVFSNAGGVAAAPATVSVQVGAMISNSKGAAHSLKFTDTAGGVETISLNKGNANVYFSGFGSLTVARNGRGTITGGGVDISSIVLTGTNRASALVIRGSAKTPVNVGGIIDATPLGIFSTTSANITGNINLNGAGSIAVGNITNSTITIGSGIPARFSLSTGAVAGSSLTSAVPNTSIRAASWTGPINAPSINTLAIKTGGLASNISTGAIGSISIGGSLTGNITATSARSIKITGDVNGSTINISGALGQLKDTGSFANSSITAGRTASLSLGNITTSNDGKTFGITTPTLASFAGIFGSTALHMGRPQLKNESVLQAYAAQQGAVFGDFEIALG